MGQNFEFYIWPGQNVEIIKKELFYATRPPMHVLLVKILPILQNYSLEVAYYLIASDTYSCYVCF